MIKEFFRFNQYFMWSVSDPYVPGEILNTLNLKACVFYFFFNFTRFQELHLTVVINGENCAVAFTTKEETVLRKNARGQVTA